ncbi:hypothetical protein E2C00_08990 [Streptomyces sp. WAC05374]|nr:hypothetical protein EF905_19550 [Streptomyces sp. WAC05374]TDF47398.1 hypothetical protein E2B92_07820 [Streptomyces sp. WAC05374]TDF57657.1 hypothetical protein E2C00_08990 [Streptomyces sp. WAC05374]TDF61762.1 hypothetical protein E2C02_00180 [Streptomyces sp. WAC05374]
MRLLRARLPGTGAGPLPGLPIRSPGGRLGLSAGSCARGGSRIVPAGVGRGDLSDQEWARREPHVPDDVRHGGRRKGDRGAVHGILAGSGTGVPWRAPPARWPWPLFARGVALAPPDGPQGCPAGDAR